jgi:SAM-dependent methyltransferase
MEPEERENLIQRYVDRFRKYGALPETLGWKKGRQKIRFQVLTDIAFLKDDSVLDVGCGFADLYDFLRQKGWEGHYTGVDIVPVLVETAKKKHPALDIKILDILRDPLQERFDYVMASGLFNVKFKLADNLKFIDRMLRKMFALSRRGVACNFMSDYVDWKSEESFYVKPEVVFAMAKRLSRRIALRHDYMPFEFAVYLFKNDESSKNHVFQDFETF